MKKQTTIKLNKVMQFRNHRNAAHMATFIILYMYYNPIQIKNHFVERETANKLI